MKNRLPLPALLCLLLISPAAADTSFVNSGQTNVLLDTAALETAASLSLSGVSDEVIAPGSLGDGSVAFPINPRTASAPLLPTTFAYDSGDFLGTFSGAIEHEGSVLFNSDSVEVGNFTIGFDGARAGTLGGAASGFFVESTVGIAAILFDIENPSSLAATGSSLDIAANLLVSPEFAGFLQQNSLASSDLSGVDVGDALVAAGAVPEPSGVALAGLVVAAAATRRRNRQPTLQLALTTTRGAAPTVGAAPFSLANRA